MLRVAQLIRSLSYQTWVLLSDLSGLFWQLADRNSRDLFFCYSEHYLQIPNAPILLLDPL